MRMTNAIGFYGASKGNQQDCLPADQKVSVED